VDAKARGVRTKPPASLVDKLCSGRAVLYQTTALGLGLLGDGSASPGASAS